MIRTLFLTAVVCFAAAGCQATQNGSQELHEAWETIEARQVAANPEPSPAAKTSAKREDDGPEPQPSKRTKVHVAAMSLAGRAIASALLLPQWKPDRIKLLGSDAAQMNPACGNDDGALIRYDHQHDALLVDQLPCWFEKSSADANRRSLVAYLGGISAVKIATKDVMVLAENERDARRVTAQLCQNIVGFQGEVACEDALLGEGAATKNGPLTPEQTAEVQKTTATLRSCADAIVAANATAVKALAAQMEPELRASAIAAWTYAGNPLPDAFDFGLSQPLITFRSKHRLVMPKTSDCASRR